MSPAMLPLCGRHACIFTDVLCVSFIFNGWLVEYNVTPHQALQSQFVSAARGEGSHCRKGRIWKYVVHRNCTTSSGKLHLISPNIQNNTRQKSTTTNQATTICPTPSNSHAPPQTVVPSLSCLQHVALQCNMFPS